MPATTPLDGRQGTDYEGRTCCPERLLAFVESPDRAVGYAHLIDWDPTDVVPCPQCLGWSTLQPDGFKNAVLPCRLAPNAQSILRGPFSGSRVHVELKTGASAGAIVPLVFEAIGNHV
jgi:hypothetical protein